MVAGLFVTLMVTFFNTSGGSSNTSNLAVPTTTAPPTSTTATGAPQPRRSEQSSPQTSTGTGSSGAGSTTAASTSPPPGGTASCPSNQPCALDSDIGNAVAAINAYRVQNGKSAVPGSVSAAAASCALSNGNNCSGGWAQTQVPASNGKADGAQAVDKIKQLGKLLNDMKSIEVGWAFDPGNQTFYFAIVRIG